MILLFAEPIIETSGEAVISANWIMLVLATIVAFFFVRTLNKIEKNFEVLTHTVEGNTADSKVHEERISRVEEYQSGSNEALANEIVAKLRSITPK